MLALILQFSLCILEPINFFPGLNHFHKTLKSFRATGIRLMSQMEEMALRPVDFPVSKTSQLPNLLCPHTLKGCCLPALRLQCPQVKTQTPRVCKPKGPVPVSAFPTSSSLSRPVSQLWDPLVRDTLPGHEVVSLCKSQDSKAPPRPSGSMSHRGETEAQRIKEA